MEFLQDSHPNIHWNACVVLNYIKRPQNKIKHTNLHVNQSKRKFNPHPRRKTCIERAHQFNQNKHPPTAIYWDTPLPLYIVMLWFASSQEHDMFTMSFKESHSKKYSLHAISGNSTGNKQS
jgi:hypothetical protein